MNTSSKKQLGYTIAEILIAVFLSSLILILVGSFYVVNKNTSTMITELAKMQEEGRYAMNLFKNEIRLAGHYGCYENVVNNLASAGSGYVDYINEYIAGSNATTDTITFRRKESTGEVLQSTMALATDNITVASNSSLQYSDKVIINDCLDADVFQISNNNPSTGTISHSTGSPITPNNSTVSLSKAYDTNATVYGIRESTYYVATGLNGNPSLFRSVNGSAEELIENVENLQITYGVDSDADAAANRYNTANNISDWTTVVSVRIELLLRSKHHFSFPGQTYIFAGVSQSGSDGRLRNVFSTTVQLRNRLST